VLTVFIGFFVVDCVRFFSAPSQSVVEICIFSVVLVALLFLQIFHFSRSSSRRNPRRRLPLLYLQAALVYVPMLVWGTDWIALPGFVASNALLVLAPWPAWVVFGLVVVGNVGIEATADLSPFSLSYIAASTVITGLVVYGLTRMSELVTEVYRSRMALAQMAVEKERVRFARDLHDLLGYSLSTITLKTELARRLGGEDWDRAVQELADILQISRRALVDVRTVSSGYRQMSLEAELRSARSVLGAAEVNSRVRADVDLSDLSKPASTVLATVLREGITNMLRHSSARNCEITVERQNGFVRLTISNDGAGKAPKRRRAAADAENGIENGPENGPENGSGSGIGNLTQRVEALGGKLVARGPEDGWFHLTAEVDCRLPTVQT
jgi:two-component system sensor histidine kinase DesK